MFFGRGIDEVLLYCDYDSSNPLTIEIESIVNEKLGLNEGDFKLTYKFDHLFVYDEIVKMPVWWDYERSYELTSELSDTSAGTGIRKIPESSRMLLELWENWKKERIKKLDLNCWRRRNSSITSLWIWSFRSTMRVSIRRWVILIRNIRGRRYSRIASRVAVVCFWRFIGTMQTSCLLLN